MEEIKAYKTADGRKFFEKNEAEDYENYLNANKIMPTFLDKAKETFKEFLIEENNSNFYIEVDMPAFWDGQKYIQDLDWFVDFLVNIALSIDGKILEFMNHVARNVNKVSGD